MLIRRSVWLNVLFFAFVFFAILSPAVLSAEESITLTTYYPSPYGVYNEMQLYPHDDPVGSCSSGRDEGLMYYDRDEHTLKVCMCKNPPACSVYGWLPASGYWAASPFNLNNIYNTNPGNVGIGTNNPAATERLDVNGNIHSSQVRVGNISVIDQVNIDMGIDTEALVSVGLNDGSWVGIGRNTNDEIGVGFGSAGGTYRGSFYYNPVANAVYTKSANGANLGFVTATGSPGGDVRMFIRNSDGNVGIGTTAPSATLDIYHIKGPTTMGHVWFGGDNPIYSDMSFDGASDGLFVFTNTGIAAGGTAFYSSATGKVPLAMTNSGDVGIGLLSGSSPTQRLDVNGQLRIRGGSPAPGYVLTSEDASGVASWKPSSGGGNVWFSGYYERAWNAPDLPDPDMTVDLGVPGQFKFCALVKYLHDGDNGGVCDIKLVGSQWTLYITKWKGGGIGCQAICLE